MFEQYKIIFVHGYTASSKENWYPPISEELKKLNVDFEIPDLPGGEHPHADEWLNKLHEVISKTDKPLVLVGHSLGTRAILLYLEKYEPKNVMAVFLVATFANRLENATLVPEDDYPDFFEHLVDLQKIKLLVTKFVILHSTDDDLPYEQAVELQKDLNAKLITYKDRGHMSDPENASEILRVLQKELSF